MNRIRFGTLLDLPDHVLDAILEHAPKHRPGDHRVHLKIHDLAIAQPDGDLVGLEFEAARETFGNRRLAHTGLPEQQDRIGALPMAEDLEHLIHLQLAAEDRRNPVLTCELIQVRGEVLEERRQLEPLPEPLVAQLVVAHAGREPGHDRFRLDPVPANDRDGNPLCLLEDGGEQVDGFDVVATQTAGVQERQLEEQTRRRREPKLLTCDTRQQVQMFLEGLEDFVRVQVQITHDLAEHVPLDLGECQAEMLIGELHVVPATGLVQGAIDHALSRLSHFALRNVEVFHRRLQ